MPKGTELTREVLDTAFPDNPVGVIHVSMHGAVINSKAMEKFGYKDGMPTPPGRRHPAEGGRHQPAGPGHGNRLSAHVRQDAVPHARDRAGRREGRAADLRRRRRHHRAGRAPPTRPQVAQLQRIAKQGGFIIDVVAYPFMTDLESGLENHPARRVRHSM